MRLSCALAGTAPRASLSGFRQSRGFSHLASAAAVQRIPARSSAPAVGVASASAGRCARGLRQGSQLGDFAETLPGTAGARCFAQACALEDSRRELTPPRAVLDTAAPATCSPHGAAAPTTARSTQAGSRRPDLAAVNDSFLALDASNESFTAPKATGAEPRPRRNRAPAHPWGACPCPVYRRGATNPADSRLRAGAVHIRGRLWTTPAPSGTKVLICCDRGPVKRPRRSHQDLTAYPQRGELRDRAGDLRTAAARRGRCAAGRRHLLRLAVRGAAGAGVPRLPRRARRCGCPRRQRR